MSVQLVEGRFRVDCPPNSFSPAAAEIYSAVFEEESAVRGVAVTAREFRSTGIQFSEEVAEPLLVLELEVGSAGPTILCRLRARSRRIEAEVASHNGELLDYAIGDGMWMPLPNGALDEVKNTLTAIGGTVDRPISLRQYMMLTRRKPQGFTIEDRTGRRLAAEQIAEVVTGDVPETFVGKLYDYQANGVRWLSFMVRNGLGGVIADEMGLGKTVQVICVVLEGRTRATKPNLVVAPATVLENWRREFTRFGPSLNVLVHSGSARTGRPGELSQHDVVICSYDTAVADVSLFRNVDWNLVVIDEAQNIKNPQAKRSIQLKTIPRTCAIAMTGTPVENRLKDLWSITDFVVPSLLGPLSEFERRHPDTVEGAVSLEPAISPLILRRTVREVATDLPERIDIPQPLQLDSASAAAYEQIRSSTLGHRTNAAGFAVLQALRMFCTHPWLTGHFTDTAYPEECSAKLRRLFELIEEIVETQGKVLVFTSYAKSVDLIRAEVATRFGIFADTVDGRVPVPERQKKIDDFSAESAAALLVLNPKAAGVGLNITAANHVIHFNLEWNPAVEDQASARAHRRGQTRPVTVHRLYYTDTVEEIINERMQHKRDLAGSAVVGTQGSTEVDDILRALRISPVMHS